ncbi:hypothetical protein EST38_g8298 [Candolleomyces aberdarensis]|uniref:Uncharacterized protein n=1 Tax=Candolleomyces aberdarensis TaxID=2316362 RepID=A0A4Q2DCW9_9AGAR|nr:hypothetical protein EST38_g8298 [Candolleomyces aberdarensis]
MPPPARQRTPGTGQEEDVRKAVRKKLLQQFRHGSSVEHHQACQALANYLSKENDFDILKNTLAPFDPDTLPPYGTAVELEKINSSMALQFKIVAVSTALIDLTNIFASLGSKDPGLEAYKSASFFIILDKWFDMIAWLKFLVWYYPTTATGPPVVGGCTQLLAAICNAYLDSKDLAGELFCFPSTIDLVFRIICQTDHINRGGVDPAQEMRCLSIFAMLLDTEPMSSTFVLHLNKADDATRRLVASSLVSRVQSLATSAEHARASTNTDAWILDAIKVVGSTIQSTDCLLHHAPELWKLFQHHDFVIKYSKALEPLIQLAVTSGKPNPEFWSLAASSTLIIINQLTWMRSPNRSSELARCARGSLVTSAFECLTHLDHQQYQQEAEAKKIQHTWDPISARHDKLVYVEYILNRLIPSLQWRADEILILDTWSFVGVANTVLSIDECRRQIWKDADPIHNDRIEALVATVKQDQSLRLVEAVFYHEDEVDTIVLALVKTHWQRCITIGERRYEIGNSDFRVALHKVVAKLYNDEWFDHIGSGHGVIDEWEDLPLDGA